MCNKEKKTSVWKLLVVYVVLYLIGTAIFAGLFHTCLLKNIDVLMYRGIIFLFIANITVSLCMCGLKSFGHMDFIMVRDIILLFCICSCVNFTFFTLIPVTVERSISVFMLSYMDENDDINFTQEDIQNVFAVKYVIDYGAFDKRFNEQIETGSIVKCEDDRYGITDRGKFIVKLFRMFAKIFNTDQRLVYPNEN